MGLGWSTEWRHDGSSAPPLLLALASILTRRCYLRGITLLRIVNPQGDPGQVEGRSLGAAERRGSVGSLELYRGLAGEEGAAVSQEAAAHFL